jgi:hypothetical protein
MSVIDAEQIAGELRGVVPFNGSPRNGKLPLGGSH